MFNPVPARLEEIFNFPCQYAIPVYQREYAWGKEEALELIEDLQSYTNLRNENLFLGNLILEKAKEQKVFIVDGQQRLTTVMLLLIACRMRARELALDKLVPRIQEKITFIDSTTGEPLGPRLLASESIREVFNHMANDSWDGTFPLVLRKRSVKRKVNKVKPIYDSFLKAVSEFDHQRLSSFLAAVYNSYVAKIEVENEIEALSIFERTNARGLDLEVSDLLKNFLFIKKVEDIEDLWARIVEHSAGTMLRMLKYFYVSKRGGVQKPQLYKKLKGYADDVGPQQLTHQLELFSDFYHVVKTPDGNGVKQFFEAIEFTGVVDAQDRYERIARALEGLKEFNVVQFCPLAYAAIECASRNGGKDSPTLAKKLIQLFEALEKYHFINNVICERVGNEVEKLYADACVSYSRSADMLGTTDALVADLKSRLATEEEFVANFARLEYSPDQLGLICYIFDRFNNSGLDPGECINIYNPDPKVRRRHFNCEHFLPQKPDPGFKIKKADEECVDNIGNLLVIYFKNNSRLGNGTPGEKIERLKDELSQNVQNLRYVQEFVAEYGPHAASWGAEQIKRRARDMALRAYREVWKIK